MVEWLRIRTTDGGWAGSEGAKDEVSDAYTRNTNQLLCADLMARP